MNAAMSDALFNVAAGVVTVATPIIATFVTMALQKFAKNRGIEIDQKNLARVDQFLVNGLNLAAANAKQAHNLPPGSSAKDFLAQRAIDYLERHGTETLKQLSADLDDPKTREAMRARIETLITDPTKPTPDILSPDKATTVVAPTTGA